MCGVWGNGEARTDRRQAGRHDRSPRRPQQADAAQIAPPSSPRTKPQHPDSVVDPTARTRKRTAATKDCTTIAPCDTQGGVAD